MIASGTEGTCQWTIDDNGKLTIGPGVIAYSTHSNQDDWSWYKEQGSVKTIDASANITWAPDSDASYMFCNFYNLISADLSGFNTTNVKSMIYMFFNCQDLLSLDLRSFNTINVTSMYGMFDGCQIIPSIDLSSFDTKNVTTMSDMFCYCHGLISLDLSNFDTSNVNYMIEMFRSCSALTSLDLSSFDTSNVRNMRRMFYSNESLTSLDLSNFDTSSVSHMEQMFYSCSALTSLDLSNFDTSRVTNMEQMFYSCSALTSLDVSSFDTSNVTNMRNMFYSCSALTSLDLSNFDTSNVTDMSYMFLNCTSLSYLEFYAFNAASMSDTTMMFQGIKCPIYIIDATNSQSVANSWRSIVAQYKPYAHFEADDNQKPDIIFSVIRVDSSGSETSTNEGRYAYLKATVTLYENYLPRGWHNSLGTKTLTGAVSLSSWSDTNTGLIYTCKAWDYINSIAGHTYSLAITDSIKDANGNVKASHVSNTITAILAKAATAISVYHDETTGSEGVAIGAFADKADLLEIAYYAQFNKNIFLSLPNYQTSGELDKYIYDTISSYGWSEVLMSSPVVGIKIKELIKRLLDAASWQ